MNTKRQVGSTIKPLLYSDAIENAGFTPETPCENEAQFFDAQVADVCEQLAQNGIRVIVAGLDMDYQGNPFGQMPNLLAKADYITKLHAICMKCGNIANISYRKVATEGQVLLGEKDIYEPRCRICAQLKD